MAAECLLGEVPCRPVMEWYGTGDDAAAETEVVLLVYPEAFLTGGAALLLA